MCSDAESRKLTEQIAILPHSGRGTVFCAANKGIYQQWPSHRADVCSPTQANQKQRGRMMKDKNRDNIKRCLVFFLFCFSDFVCDTWKRVCSQCLVLDDDARHSVFPLSLGSESMLLKWFHTVSRPIFNLGIMLPPSVSKSWSTHGAYVFFMGRNSNMYA